MHLDEAVIKLHEVARLVEQQIGQGVLSQDIRDCADRLSTLLKPISTNSEAHDPVI